MNEDIEHLRQYAKFGSEDAFSSLVQRYLPLVYRVAVRRLGGDVHRAEDVTQMVFTALARNARSLTYRSNLAGWLFTTTRYLAAKAVRTEVRRQSHEQEAHMTLSAITEDSSELLSLPLHRMLDDVMIELSQVDRQVLLLRYHQGLRLAEIASQLGLTDNAVQKRVDRALDRLRDLLSRRGVSSTAAALALVFEQQATLAVPAGLAAASTAAGIACGAGSSGLIGAGIPSLLTTSKVQLGIVAAVLAAGAAGTVWLHRENTLLGTEKDRQITAAQTRVAELSASLEAQSKRTAAAEADVAALLKAVQAAGQTRLNAPQEATRLVDTQEMLKTRLAKADELIRNGKPQEGLDELLRSYREFQAKRPAGAECQRVMSAIVGLGRSFQPAKTALRELRDTASAQLDASRGASTEPGSPVGDRARGLILEIALLNERLDDTRNTIALYDSLQPDDSRRRSIVLVAHDSFVNARRYSDAMIGKPFGYMLTEFEMGMKNSARGTGGSLPNYSGHMIERTAKNIEVLTGAEKVEEARILTEKLLAFDSSDSTRAILKRHMDRAVQPPAP